MFWYPSFTLTIRSTHLAQNYSLTQERTTSARSARSARSTLRSLAFHFGPASLGRRYRHSQDLIDAGTVTPELAGQLKDYVAQHKTILICASPSSAKHTHPTLFT